MNQEEKSTGMSPSGQSVTYFKGENTLFLSLGIMSMGFLALFLSLFYLPSNVANRRKVEP